VDFSALKLFYFDSYKKCKKTDHDRRLSTKFFTDTENYLRTSRSSKLQILEMSITDLAYSTPINVLRLFAGYWTIWQVAWRHGVISTGL